jgi:hypothetical protein
MTRANHAALVRATAKRAGQKGDVMDSARNLAVRILKITAASPNPTVAAAAGLLCIIDAVEDEIAGVKAVLVSALTEGATE